MAFQVSPGVNISEIDLSTVVPAVSTTSGAISGVFRWGPTDERVLVTSEVELARIFGKPKTGFNTETFFSAADFLAYSNQLYVNRVSTGSKSTFQTGGGVPETVEYENITGASTLTEKTFSVRVEDQGAGNQYLIDGIAALELTMRTGVTYTFDVSDASNANHEFAFSTTDGGVHNGGVEYNLTVLRNGTPGDAGATVTISVDGDTPATLYYYCTNHDGMGGDARIVPTGSGNIFTVEKTPTQYNVSVINGGSDFIVNDEILVPGTELGGTSPENDLTIVVTTVLDADSDGVGSITGVSSSGTVLPEVVDPTIFHFNGKFIGELGNSLRIDIIRRENFTQIDSAKYFDDEPSTTNNMHIAIIDVTGEFSGIAGSALEIYENLSTVSGSQDVDGTNTYVTDVVNLKSNYIEIPVNNNPDDFPTGENRLNGGGDGDAEGTDGVYSLLTGDNTGYGLFSSPQDVDVSLIITGKATGGISNTGLARHVIEEICETRKDCIAFVSPPRTATVDANRADMRNQITNFVNDLSVDSTYGVMDSGYKYRYDKYNDRYIYTPLNGDVAGLCVKTDSDRDPWFSPAGYNRGFIKNVVKLPFNPNQAERDALYKLGVNPVMSQPGQGVLLFGDRTMTRKTSAFDRINVRRLFIVLEKAVAAASRFTLFEFNDEFTRAQFVNLIEPFLRDIQGRRGIYDFKVVCDSTNNTSEIIDRNEFVGDIYVKPARSINYVQLNFVAVRTGVEFEEIVGRS